MKEICLVAPLNQKYIGGRVEEVNLWAQILLKNGYKVSIFSSLYASNYFAGCKETEAIDLIFGSWINLFSNFRSLLRRVWLSRFFEKKRKALFQSNEWEKFALNHDALVLFIQDTSREREIFNSAIDLPIFLRFTGLVQNNLNIEKDTLLSQMQRNYIFHSECLTAKLNLRLPSFFLDQATLLEKRLLEIPITRGLQKFGLLGMFLEVKRFEEIIGVFKYFPEKELHLYGEGHLQGSYEGIIKDLDLKNVKIHPYVSNAKIPEVYRDIDCLIINSSEESGPLNAIEAMAAGKLLLTQRVGSMPDRIPGSPLFFKDHKPESILDKMRWLVSLEDERIVELKKGLREVYLDRFSLQVLERKILQILTH
ncbi:glycosyltransferase family 4 protein [Algoriphagus hitonicola]|uniref:Glycosyltransferase involved in cell wall bisynthesis n=1 Tax=Algoriphagus hitonicola TaxID=435880 RepID=A0A1I2X6H9_9BACT|nr:glycosyltransferase family 4 protein [Algoriphagus hitonicola]SFH08296.1 Glycosyltransferase involved in cell wall bisynthesis [Algoriphagus hitonicola]